MKIEEEIVAHDIEAQTVSGLFTGLQGSCAFVLPEKPEHMNARRLQAVQSAWPVKF